jgi:integrase/recombinase XerD
MLDEATTVVTAHADRLQEAASHADPRTTMRYDRARGSLDRHATHIVAAYVVVAAR